MFELSIQALQRRPLYIPFVGKKEMQRAKNLMFEYHIHYVKFWLSPLTYSSSLCDGGVMVTASHLPADRNGLKFFTANGRSAYVQFFATIGSKGPQY